MIKAACQQMDLGDIQSQSLPYQHPSLKQQFWDVPEHRLLLPLLQYIYIYILTMTDYDWLWLCLCWISLLLCINVLSYCLFILFSFNRYYIYIFILYYIILYFIIIYFSIIYFIIIYFIITYCIILYYVILYFIIIYYIIFYYNILYYNILSYIILYYIILYVCVIHVTYSWPCRACLTQLASIRFARRLPWAGHPFPAGCLARCWWNELRCTLYLIVIQWGYNGIMMGHIL